jgi:hypothetical protein
MVRLHQKMFLHICRDNLTQVVTKVWYLLGEVTRDDLEMLQRAGVNYSIVTDDYPIDTIGFHNNSWVKVNHNTQIITTTKEQEVWLKLCFGDRIEHFSTRYDIK